MRDALRRRFEAARLLLLGSGSRIVDMQKLTTRQFESRFLRAVSNYR